MEKNEVTKFGKYEGLLLFAISMTGFTAALIVSLQAPFFPPEAEKKHVTASEYGVTFGMYGLAVFLVSPIVGSMLQEVGGRCVLYRGALITTSSTIVFGFLTYIYSHIGFVLLSYILRIVEGIGASAVLVALFSFSGSCFPGNVGLSYGIVQAMFGIGLSVGPLIGAMFYNIGGFPLPFIAAGVMNLVTGGMSFAILPSSTIQRKSSGDEERKSWDLFRSLRLLKISSIQLYTASAIISVLTGNFINAILEPDLSQFDLTVVEVSLVFLVQPAMQCIVCGPSGSVCDRVSNPQFVTLFGAILSLIGAVFIGPLSLLPFRPYEMAWSYPDKASLILTVVSSGLIGVGNSVIAVSAYFITLREARDHGCDDETASSLISGLTVSAYATGICLGPLLAGILLDQFGFRQSTIFIIILHIALCAALGINTWTEFIGSRTAADKKTPSNNVETEIESLLPEN